MSTLSANGAEIYELIQRLMQLHEAQHAFRYRMAEERQAAMDRERRYREEEHKVRQEAAETIKKIREKLGVPEPASKAEGDISSMLDGFGKFFDDFLQQFGMKPSAEPPLK